MEGEKIYVQVKYSPYGECEIKFGPSHAVGVFHCRRQFHAPQAHFIRSAGTNFTEKALADARAFSMSMGDGKTAPFGALRFQFLCNTKLF